MNFTSVIEDVWPPAPNDEAELEAYKRWKAQSDAAQACSTRVGDELPVVDVFRPLFKPSSAKSYEFRWPAPVDSPPPPLRYQPVVPRRVTLIRPLHFGYGKWSQVWRAEVDIPGVGVVDAAVKLVQESLFPSARQLDPTYKPDLNEGLFRTAADIVTREVTTYETARPLWGREVPYYYGTFIASRFALACGHLVPGIILEYVDGRAFDEAMDDACRIPVHKESRKIEDLSNAQKRAIRLMRGAAVALYKFGALGLRHNDLVGRNVIVCQEAAPSAGHRRVVLIDFGHAFFDPANRMQRSKDAGSLFMTVRLTGFEKGCWRTYLRDKPAEADDDGWLAWWRTWGRVDPAVSDHDEKQAMFDEIERRRGQATWEQTYKLTMLPRWAEGLDWSSLDPVPTPSSVANGSTSQ